MAPEVGGRDATGLVLPDGAPFRPASRHGAQHDEHDRDRSVYHDPAPHVRTGWSASNARLGRRVDYRLVRQHRLERARRRDAGFGRLVRLPAPGLRDGESRPPDGLSLRMAVRAQWAPRDRVRIYRVLALSGIHLERDHAATDDARDYDHRPRQPRAALPADQIDRGDHGSALGMHVLDRRRLDSNGGYSFRRKGRLLLLDVRL